MTDPPYQPPLSLHLQLLAILHHIMFPEQKLEDLPDRIAKSRKALLERATKWVDGMQVLQVRCVTSSCAEVGVEGWYHRPF